MDRHIVALHELLELPIHEWFSKLERSSNYELHQCYESHRIDLDVLMEHPIWIRSWTNCKICKVGRFFWVSHLLSDFHVPERSSDVVSKKQQSSRTYESLISQAHHQPQKKTSIAKRVKCADKETSIDFGSPRKLVCVSDHDHTHQSSSVRLILFLFLYFIICFFSFQMNY